VSTQDVIHLIQANDVSKGAISYPRYETGEDDRDVINNCKPRPRIDLGEPVGPEQMEPKGLSSGPSSPNSGNPFLFPSSVPKISNSKSKILPKKRKLAWIEPEQSSQTKPRVRPVPPSSFIAAKFSHLLAVIAGQERKPSGLKSCNEETSEGLLGPSRSLLI
jgi:hypothetical protein